MATAGYLSNTNMNALLDPLSPEPMQHLARWQEEAWKKSHQANANAMVLSTVALQKGEILPSSRVVLCKHIDTDHGFLVFFTNYHSRKGQELEQLRNAAAVFHWDAMGRQVRVEGLVVRSPAQESDAYFASRPHGSQVSALASAQSEPVASREALAEQFAAAEKRYADNENVPRPAHWGGYRLWATAVELWVHGESRRHDRARWIRTVAMDDNGQPHPDNWSVTRLQP